MRPHPLRSKIINLATETTTAIHTGTTKSITDVAHVHVPHVARATIIRSRLRITRRTVTHAKGIFLKAQAPAAGQPAPFVLAASLTTFNVATPQRYGTETLPTAARPRTTASSTPKEILCVSNGNAPMAATLETTNSTTNVRDAGARSMALRVALKERKGKVHTLYKPEGWALLLKETGLLSKYHHIPECLVSGFSGGIPPIEYTYHPPNNTSVEEHIEAFWDIVNIEFEKGRFLGPFSAQDIKSAIGHFQTAPLSLVPKPGKPGKFRLIQNLSFPHNPSRTISSINSRVDSDLFPCTYGTFSTICLTIWRLPPDSQGAVRDVAEAYRTVPLHHSQWAALAIQLPGNDAFAIDTALCFGFGPSAGIYGNISDTGLDILRAKGIGPASKWVDDHLFFRIKRKFLDEYNRRRAQWAREIVENGDVIISGGSKWYKGATMPNDCSEDFDEDVSSPIQDLSLRSPRSTEDASFTYCMDDIDYFSSLLGIPWELSKDRPFSTSPLFTGFVWNLTVRTVDLSTEKREKYIRAISDWQSKRTHSLREVQKLYGKLLHAAQIIPAGRAYLTNLEVMLAMFDSRPFLPRTPPRNTPDDIHWWQSTLSNTLLSRPIPGPCIIHDFHAYSDASSGHGIGIVINEHWRAWDLIPGWKRDGRDIGWAEAIGFEFLVRTIINSQATGIHFKVFGDNKGIVEGWWTGRSRNRASNEIFKHIHQVIASAKCTVLTRYVPSKDNPADGPSRRIYPPTSRLLPPIDIPAELRPFIREISETVATSRTKQNRSTSQPLHPVGRSHTKLELQRRAFVNREFERRGKELFKVPQD